MRRFAKILLVLSVFRWVYYLVVSNIPIVSSVLDWAWMMFLASSLQGLAASVQLVLAEKIPQLYQYGLSFFQLLQQVAIWFWDALFILIPFLAVIILIIWNLGGGLVSVFRRFAIQIRGLFQRLPRSHKPQNHLILYVVFQEKEYAFDLGRQRTVHVGRHCDVTMDEHKQVYVERNGRKELLTGSYRADEMYLELIQVSV